MSTRCAIFPTEFLTIFHLFFVAFWPWHLWRGQTMTGGLRQFVQIKVTAEKDKDGNYVIL